MIYLVSYDLHNEKNYAGVAQAIIYASTGKYRKILGSVWLIKSDYRSADDVYNIIKPSLDADDRIVVCEITNNRQGFLDNNHLMYIMEYLTE